MRKFAAHYLVTDVGVFLKNGIALVGDDGFIVQYIDTTGDLKEIEQLTFYNGILMGGTQFTKTISTQTNRVTDNSFQKFVFQSVADSTQLSIENLIDLGKVLQLQFPEMKIPAILNEMSDVLLGEGGFIKEIIPGIYLLSKVDLVELKFTPKSWLKLII